jgi:hypothetical protein
MNRALFVGAIVLCLLPVIILGPGLWRDFHAQGRWETVTGMRVADVSCFGRAPIFQACGFSIVTSQGIPVDYIPTAVTGLDISLRSGAVVHSRASQSLSVPVLVSPSGMTARLTAIFLLQFAVILVTLIARRDADSRTRRIDEANLRRRNEILGLSRDRRDRF